MLLKLLLASVTTVVMCELWMDHNMVHNGRSEAKAFFNEWTVEVDGGEEVAQLVALEFGYIFGGPLDIDEDILENILVDEPASCSISDMPTKIEITVDINNKMSNDTTKGRDDMITSSGEERKQGILHQRFPTSSLSVGSVLEAKKQVLAKHGKINDSQKINKQLMDKNMTSKTALMILKKRYTNLNIQIKSDTSTK